MGVTKPYTPRAITNGSIERIQALTGGSTATRIQNYGVTTITSTAGGSTAEHAFVLKKPVKGLRKTLLVDPNSTREVLVVADSTTHTLFGSTGNALRFSTGAGTKRAELIGLSATQWALLHASTGVTVVGSTKSA
jgi:hypothetical protein